uniref:Putative salivary kunitz domain protein n=1 Tax=Ixodes ricinus TaxID=34613 RepID=A0A147BXC4_IXORI
MKFLVLTICFVLVPGNSIKERWKNPVRGRCALPEPTYICRPAVLKYRFNRDKRRCEWYTFGGCGDAIFDTMDQCTKTCGVYAEDPCLLPLDEGRTCKRGEGAPMPMFRFDLQEQQCVEFNYKGCGGNGNNFLEKRECWTTCEKYVRSPCSFPIHGGDHCSRNTLNVLVFGYNSVTKRCERFLHSGCG